MATKFTLYSWPGSQWAQVAHLTLAAKGFTEDEYEIKNVDLLTAENFNVDYLKINPHGTVPSLTSPSLDKPLVQSADILRYLDELRTGNGSLVPQDGATRAKVKELLDLVHSDSISTNLILLQSRDTVELQGKRDGMFNDFIGNRQSKLEKEAANHPEHPFYGPKSRENGQIHKIYTQDANGSEAHEDFFSQTDEAYRTFAAGLDKLESLLVLPYAAGSKVTEADYHVAPWLAHALWGAETDPKQIQNFDALEALIRKSAPNFKVGPKTREWWANIAATEAFKKVYPALH